MIHAAVLTYQDPIHVPCIARVAAWLHVSGTSLNVPGVHFHLGSSCIRRIARALTSSEMLREHIPHCLAEGWTDGGELQ